MKDTKKKLPSLSDSDIVTRSNSQNEQIASGSGLRKASTIAMALAFTTASATMFTSCADFADCDTDVTTYADPAADSYDDGSYDTGTYADSYDYGQYDISDSDTTRSADTRCDW